MSYEVLFDLLTSGYSVEYKFLSICKLDTRYYKGEYKHTYQVHCEDYKSPFSEIYKDINDAIIKFFELMKEVYGKIR